MLLNVSHQSSPAIPNKASATATELDKLRPLAMSADAPKFQSGWLDG